MGRRKLIDDEEDGEENDQDDAEDLWFDLLSLSPEATYEEVEIVDEESTEYFENEAQKLIRAKDEGLAWAQQKPEKPWYEELGLSPDATDAEIKAAHREKIKKYHPDLVSGLGEELKIVAEQITKKLNAAKEEGLSQGRRSDEASSQTDGSDEDDASLDDNAENEEFWWDILGLPPDDTLSASAIKRAYKEKKKQLDIQETKIYNAIRAAYYFISLRDS